MRDMLLGRMKTLIESMIKERLRIKVQWLRKGYRLRVIQENFEEGYVKAKKKWKWRRMPINSKRGKRGFNGRKTQQMPKVKKKIKFHIFWCVYDKASDVFKKIRLVIHQRKVGLAIWPMLREFWSLKLTRLYVTFSTMTKRERELMNSWCWS